MAGGGGGGKCFSCEACRTQRLCGMDMMQQQRSEAGRTSRGMGGTDNAGAGIALGMIGAGVDGRGWIRASLAGSIWARPGISQGADGARAGMAVDSGTTPGVVSVCALGCGG